MSTKLKILIIFFISFFFTFIFKQSAFADLRCGDGFVCWEENGGSDVLFNGCEAWKNVNTWYCAGRIDPDVRTLECFADCTGSADCTGEIPNDSCSNGTISCNVAVEGLSWFCSFNNGEIDFDANAYCGLQQAENIPCSGSVYSGGKCEFLGTPTCTGSTETVTIGCCYSESATPTPILEGSLTPGAGITPTPTYIPFFSGNIYDDANAITLGLGGTDNLCIGSTNNLSDGGGATATVTRTGESNSASILDSFSLTTATTNSDYTVTLDLPFPPTDPANAWQCACNADPSDPYRCVYTNQTPSSGATLTNFFIQRANLNNNAWWQTLGGNVYAIGNIESRIPETCLPPNCIPALSSRDQQGNVDSAGFPITHTGKIVTSISGNTYIHEADGRTTSMQGNATGVNIPKENYAYFYRKIGGQAIELGNANKPVSTGSVGVYKYPGNMTINDTNPWHVSNSEQYIVFVDGNLIVDDTPDAESRLVTVEKGGIGFIQFVVSGDIRVTTNVGYNDIYTDTMQANIANLEGVFLADGDLIIEGEANTQDRKFIGAGSFIGWGGVQLQRSFDDGSLPELNNTSPTETFIYRPDLLVNVPQMLKSAHVSWQEVAPRWEN